MSFCVGSVEICMGCLSLNDSFYEGAILKYKLPPLFRISNLLSYPFLILPSPFLEQ